MEIATRWTSPGIWIAKSRISYEMPQAEMPKFLRWSRMFFCEKDNVSSGLCSIVIEAGSEL